MFSANKVINCIKEDIESNFDETCHVENFFGFDVSAYDTKFTQANAIYIIYEGCDYEIETGSSMTGSITISFLIIDQVLATASAKEDFLLDRFRDYITWKEFSALATHYPDADFLPFFPSVESLVSTEEGGIAVFVIRGNISFVKRNIGG